MKKLLTFALALTLCLCMAAPGLASAINQDENFDVDGTIGLSAAAGTTLIDVTLPASNALSWVADETVVTAGVPQVWAATYGITNNSTFVDLIVKLDSFTQDNVTTNTDALTVAGDLTLNLTGDLAVTGTPNFANNWSTGYVYPTMLYANNATASGTNAWTFSFGGSYAGTLPATPYTPEYDMVLNFAIN